MNNPLSSHRRHVVDGTTRVLADEDRIHVVYGIGTTHHLDVHRLVMSRHEAAALVAQLEFHV